MTWSMIESVIEILNNNEGIESYAERVFKLAKLECHPNDSDLSWLSVCSRLLYLKFLKAVEGIESEIRAYSFKCFRLLAECTDLTSFEVALKNILIFFLSAQQTAQWKAARIFIRISSLLEKAFLIKT
jgi:hypothetical protein